MTCVIKVGLIHIQISVYTTIFYIVYILLKSCGVVKDNSYYRNVQQHDITRTYNVCYDILTEGCALTFCQCPGLGWCGVSPPVQTTPFALFSVPSLGFPAPGAAR